MSGTILRRHILPDMKVVRVNGENEDVRFQEASHDNFFTRLQEKKKKATSETEITFMTKQFLIVYGQSQIPEVQTLHEGRAEINLFLHLSWST